MTKEKVISKEDFFQNIYECALGNFSTMENYMGIKGIIGQVFDIDSYELGSAYDLPEFTHKHEEDRAKQHFMNHRIWYPFECVYEYAVNGNGQKCCLDEITDCIDFSHILNSDHFQISTKSHEVITMALVRYNLEHDTYVNYFNADVCNYPLAIALLADVDVRTIKNAVSSQEIETITKIHLSAPSLKQWLLKRKGFKPTFYSEKDTSYTFNSPTSFAKLLKDCREKLDKDFNPSDLISTYPNNPNILEELELGIFNLPMNSVSLISKTYDIPYPTLLKQILKTYYPNEYALLTN
ncbi:hypothetical protein G9F31_06730 [Acinetobacter sp. 187]|uniref:hypothetical protein n=1 Tax=Acinetobacter lanii TaxID=2715163 RepID=UPI00140B936D|nr:hypothetical protein [Acinetobacter lanii]NHC03463.1 hypothetical protein [Acinetobacter lanii]